MNLRIARKIVKAIGTSDEARYTQFQIERALARVEHANLSRASARYWEWLMDDIGVEGRAELCRRWGRYGDAFNLLMARDRRGEDGP